MIHQLRLLEWGCAVNSFLIKNMKDRLLTIVGTVMTVIAFTAMLSRSTYFLPPTEPPTMRPLEGIEYLVVVHGHMFLFIGIVGIFLTVLGVHMFWKERTGKRDMRK